MTISSTGTRYSYSGNGVTTAFSFPRQFFLDADLDVYLVDNVSGVAVLQVLNTHYTVAGAGSPSGGTVNMLAAPATGKTLVIVRDTALTQGLDLDNVSSFPMPSIEAAFDRAMMAIDELTTKVGRAIMAPLTSILSFDYTMPTPVASKVLGVNVAGNGFELKGWPAWVSGAGAPAGGLGAVNDYYLDTATGDVYQKTGVSTWTFQLNMRGPQGVPGNMTGPGTSVAGNLPTFASTSGSLLQDSGISVAGLGNVSGPAAAVDSSLAAFDGTTGKLLKDAAIPLSRVVQKDASGNVGIGVAPSSRLHLGGETAPYATSLTINPTGHATSRRAGIGLDQWLVGQDSGGVGTKNFFLYSLVLGASVLNVDVNGNFTVVKGALGYGPGGGGAVSQSTSKTTGVTLNKPAGQITMNAAALGASSAAIFTLTNSFIAATDGVVVTIQSPTQKYTGICVGVAAGSCDIRITNTTAGSLSEAVVVNYQVIKGANS